ncbi:hypothetical protein cypCar_00014123 [Cyprinus carpio]|nr:hypothetical protein cypCar_00014123 [Cyprinus carpio]
MIQTHRCSGGAGPLPPPNTTSTADCSRQQAQVEEVVDIMRVNVDKFWRETRSSLSWTTGRDALQAGASPVRKLCRQLRNKYCGRIAR